VGPRAGTARAPDAPGASDHPALPGQAPPQPTLPGQTPPQPSRRGRARVARAGVAALETLAAGLAAAIPVVAATIKAIEAGWVPVADRGIIATRAHDVFTSHGPLVGQYTLAGEVTGKVTHSLGPMLFWLLAPAAYGGSDVGMTITMGALNTVCIAGCVALARRRGGRALMVMTAAAIALMCQSLAAETFHDVWNPSAGLFPFTLLIFLCWSLACGDYRLLPVTVLVASFVAQTHLTYVPPTLALLAVGLGGLAVGALARRARGTRPPWRAVAWGLATLLVAVLCWSATIQGQLSERPGNLTLVVDTATERKATLGAEVGWHAVVDAVGITPWWLQTPASRWQRKYEVRARPSALASNSTVAVLAALALIAAAALARRRREVATLALIALAVCPALGVVAASTPTPPRLSATLGYTTWWGSQVGMTVWLALAWTLLVSLRWAVRAAAGARLHPTQSRPAALASVALTLAGIGGVAAVGDAVAQQGKPDEHQITYAPIKAIDARLAQIVPRGGTVLLEGALDGATMPVKPAVRYFLVARGTRVLAPGSFLRLGTWYELYKRPYSEALYLSDTPHPPVKRVALIFQVGFREGRMLNKVYVWRRRRPGR
jgi:hypothetical protein